MLWAQDLVKTFMLVLQRKKRRKHLHKNMYTSLKRHAYQQGEKPKGGKVDKDYCLRFSAYPPNSARNLTRTRVPSLLEPLPAR